METLTFDRNELRRYETTIELHRRVSCNDIVTCINQQTRLDDAKFERVVSLMNLSVQYNPPAVELSEIVKKSTELFRSYKPSSSSDLQVEHALLLRMLLEPPWQLEDIDFEILSKLSLSSRVREVAYQYLLSGPQIFNDTEQIEYHFDFTDRLTTCALTKTASEANQSNFWSGFLLSFLTRSNFIPIYFSAKNPRDLMRKRAELLRRALTTAYGVMPASLPQKPWSETPRRPIRLGIMNAHFTDQTETYSTIPVFEFLDEGFETHLLATREFNSEIERYAKSKAHQFHVLPPSLQDSINYIKALNLDLIWYGTNLTAVPNHATLLALQRLCPVQVTSVSSCVSTGIATIDAFISSSGIEPDDAQSQYTERLLLKPGMAHCQAYAPNSSWPKEFHQNIFEIQESTARAIYQDQPKFISGANFYKLTPATRHVWYEILQSLPTATLTLYPFNPNWSSSYKMEQFAELFWTEASQYQIDENRITFKKNAPTKTEVYLELAKHNIYLDSFPFSGINSLLDPLFCGIPVVCMCGDSFRSNLASSLLEELGCTQLLAKTPEQYKSIALRLATTKAHRILSSQYIALSLTKHSSVLNREHFCKGISEALLGLLDSRIRNCNQLKDGN